MAQNQAIKKILLETENFQAHLRRVSKPGHQLHPLDIDLMMAKLRGIYEEVMQMHRFTGVGNHDAPPAEPTTVSKQQSAADAAGSAVNADVPGFAEPPITVHQAPEPVVEITKNKPEELHEKQIEVIINTPSPVVELQPEIIRQEPMTEHYEIKPERESARPPVKTTLDLFAQSGAESIASRFGADDDPSIAARMQKAKINDLRSAIGINDKFLFINDLFRGNMQQYNKVLDELNDFKSLGGAQTYLMELKVEHQWDAESNAFNRLSHFVERRFGA